MWQFDKKIGMGLAAATAACLAPAPAYAAVQPIWLEVNQAYYLNTGSAIDKVAVVNPNIADVAVLGPSALNIIAKETGTTGLTIWTKNGMRQEFSVSVSPMNSSLAQMIQKAINLPGVRVEMADGKVLLRGMVANQSEKIMAEQVASMYVKGTTALDERGNIKTNASSSIVNMLEMSNPLQVNLEAWIVDIADSDKKDLGIQYANSKVGYSETTMGGSTFTTAEIQFGTAGLFAGGTNFHDITGKWFDKLDWQIQALASEGKMNILSRPNITTMSGETAEITIGGSIPFVIYGNNNYGTPTVEWKDYGIKLHIEPVVDKENNVTSRIEAEISSLDYANAVTINNTTYPALTKRTANAVINVPSGMMMAIGGLMNNQDQETIKKIPLLSNIPILGEFFKHRSNSKDKRELVILIRPRIVNETTPVKMGPKMEKKFQDARREEANLKEIDVNGEIPEAVETEEVKEAEKKADAKKRPVKATEKEDSILGKYLNQDVLPAATPEEKAAAEK